MTSSPISLAAPDALSMAVTATARAAGLRPRERRFDPRLYQIAVLAGLLLYGVLALDFEIGVPQAAVLLATALVTQYAGTRLRRLPAFDPRSAMISGLSLCLLVRTNSLGLAALAAVAAVGSKFVLRIGGKHVWNPTNFGIVLLILASGRVWVSPGQWGNAALLAFLVACLGGLVVNRAARADVTYAFLASYLALVFGRALWLGQPAAIPLHQLASGAFLVFTFFMISDPKTTPDSRAGRIVFAALVAGIAGFITFVLYRQNGLLFALALAAPAVPLLDRLLPGGRYAWPGRTAVRHGAAAAEVDATTPFPRRIAMRRLVRTALVFALAAFATGGVAHAFCGFYVAKADTKLFNRASQVVMARDGDRTVLTMANDFQGDPKEFAIVIPVPTFLARGQIHVGDKALIDHLDAYSAPRLVEYFDPDPCQMLMMDEAAPPPRPQAAPLARKALGGLGVKVEAQYTIGEYDIVILSAQESAGLAAWLAANGYRVPRGAPPVLASYLKQGMHFFVAKVDLKERAKLGFTYLRPLQIAYESPKFMLPIRLGMVNANGPQEIFVYALTRQGRVETTDYRTVKLPAGMDVPLFVKDEFGGFYKAMFARQVAREDMRAVFLEYAWDMSWCDPCAAEPLSADELRKLGVFWLAGGATGSQQIFVTRLHVRYDAAHFPEDLVFQETADRENFQGHYVIRHPWRGEASCPEAAAYRSELGRRQEQDAETLAALTGWGVDRIRGRMSLKTAGKLPEPEPWWKHVWDR
ncbi:MAG TPA: DUF2330 domain-containing protein [Thermoanaerobaculia bacterium]